MLELGGGRPGAQRRFPVSSARRKRPKEGEKPALGLLDGEKLEAIHRPALPKSGRRAARRAPCCRTVLAA